SEAATAQAITATEVRVPQITRESTSKPVTVVPRGWAADGGCWVPKRTPSDPVSAKPWGASSGASRAVSSRRPSSTRPVTSMPRCRPTLLRRWLRIGRRRYQGARRRSATWLASAARPVAPGSPSPTGSGFERVTSVPHSRVDERGDHVDHEVRERDDHGQHHDDALHGDVVAGLHVLGEHVSQPVPLEGGLGE